MSAALPTIREILDKHRNLIGDTVAEALEKDLTQREDLIADMLRVAGAQLGTFPEFVAKVLMDVGLGTPVEPDVQQHLNTQFASRMEWLQEQFRNNE